MTENVDFLTKLALFNGSFIEAISYRKFNYGYYGLENDKLYCQKHRHAFYSSKIFLDRKISQSAIFAASTWRLQETFGTLGHIIGMPQTHRVFNLRKEIVST